VVLGLLVREPALPAQLLHQRMIRGEQLQLAVAKEVGTAVAHVSERHLVALQHRRGQGRAHARDGRVLLREVVDALVRGLGDRTQERLRRLFAPLGGLEGLGGEA
jgi:hypothetical protein